MSSSEGLVKEITALRKAKGVTQQELAEKTALKQSAIARMECGKAEPRLGTILKITDALNCKLEIVPR